MRRRECVRFNAYLNNNSIDLGGGGGGLEVMQVLEDYHFHGAHEEWCWQT